MPSLQVIEKTLQKIEVLPSSIPHFLHWDIAYLWMLEREPGERTKLWNERIAAWKRLVALLLLDKLRLEEEPLAKPFSEYGGQLGIQKVVWLFDKREGAKEPIGVLSPTVLVRPLPDFKATDLNNRQVWPEDPSADRSGSARLGYFVDVAVRKLGKSEGIPARLAEILHKNFKDLKPGQPEPGIGQAFSLLKRIQWIPAALESEPVSLLIYAPGIRHYIPVCQWCQIPLTKKEEEEAVSVSPDQDQFPLTCRSCRRPTAVRLSDLMIWQRKDRRQVVVWQDREPPGVPQAGEVYPPPATIQGGAVMFEWSEGETRDDPCRFLKLRFEHPWVGPKKFNQIRFRSLLVIGPREQFRGLPIRPEWRDAVASIDDLKWDEIAKGYKYRIALHGWPFAFDLYELISSEQEAPNLLLGIYPDFIPGWKSYRVFAVGENHEDYLVCERSDLGPDTRRMPWCLQRRDWPGTVCVLRRTNPNVGATMDVPASTVPGARGGTDLFLGIDFGTTNSLVYFAAKGEDEDLKPQKHAVAPTRLADKAKILAGDRATLSRVAGGWFLHPPTANQRFDPDDYLIPSAFWDGGEFPVIRWGDARPFTNAAARHGFKWDRPNQEAESDSERKAYLKELLFLVLPYAVKEKGLGKQVRLKLGWAFPLAFGHEGRLKMLDLQADLAAYLGHELMDLEVENYDIDESRANVRARGDFNPGDTLLVADMGGGTLDLALFTFREGRAGQSGQDYQQIGSVRFGGEDFLECLIESRGEKPEERYWLYRDSITDPTKASPMRGNIIASRRLAQFTTMACELLRTMYCALPDGPRKVHMILAGNGWRLVEAISEETPRIGPMRVFENFYSPEVGSLGCPEFTVYPDQEFTPPLRKHCVAQGALKNAVDQGRELAQSEETTGSKLPAGRTVRFSYSLNGQQKALAVRWDDLVGEAGKRLADCSVEVLKGSTVVTEFESGAPTSQGWQDHWAVALLPKPASLVPAPERMREWLCNNLGGNPGSVYLVKGPLQLLMERRWLDYLRERG